MTGRAEREGLAPEMELAIACCAWPLTSERAARVRHLASADLDWTRFGRLVDHHGIAGLVQRALPAAGVTLHGETCTALAVRAQSQVRANLTLAAEAVRLERELRSAGIDAVFLKGTSLAVRLYGDLGLRSGQDIDVLVDPASVAGASKVLAGLGYDRVEPPGDLDPAHLEFVLSRRKDVKLVHAQTGVPVELHWRPFLNRHAFRLGQFATQAVVLSGGARLTTLGDEELFAYLCVHGANHWWNRLKWLADIGAFLAPLSERGCERLYKVAERLGAGRAAAQAITLCEQLFALPVPPPIAARIRRVVGLKWVQRTVFAAWGLGDDGADRHRVAFGTTRGSLSTVLLGNGWRYYGRELLNLLVNESDVVAVPLPRGLRFLYPVLRLPLWAWRHLGLRRRATSP